MLTFDVDAGHLAECELPLAACRACSQAFGLEPYVPSVWEDDDLLAYESRLE